MRPDKLTLKAQEALQEAQQLAEEMSHQQIEADHLLKALLAQEEGIVNFLTQVYGGKVGKIVNIGWAQEIKF